MRMTKWLRILANGVTISACGRIHSTVLTPPNNLAVFREMTLLPVQVISVEQNADAIALNEQWKQFATSEIQSMLANKGIGHSANGGGSSTTTDVDVRRIAPCQTSQQQ
jgi:hypothetical protein